MTALEAIANELRGMHEDFQELAAKRPMTLDELAAAWISAKAEEAAANKRRVEIEEEILSLIECKEEGATTVALGNGMKLTATGKLSYSADMGLLVQLAAALPADLRPIKTEPKLDETGAKYLRNNEPEVWNMIAPAITIKPAKTSITIKA